MNDLGALYYMGDLVEQDYAKAAELYEMAADAGCFQSIINRSACALQRSGIQTRRHVRPRSRRATRQVKSIPSVRTQS